MKKIRIPIEKKMYNNYLLIFNRCRHGSVTCSVETLRFDDDTNEKKRKERGRKKNERKITIATPALLFNTRKKGGEFFKNRRRAVISTPSFLRHLTFFLYSLR